MNLSDNASHFSSDVFVDFLFLSSLEVLDLILHASCYVALFLLSVNWIPSPSSNRFGSKGISMQFIL